MADIVDDKMAASSRPTSQEASTATTDGCKVSVLSQATVDELIAALENKGCFVQPSAKRIKREHELQNGSESAGRLSAEIGPTKPTAVVAPIKWDAGNQFIMPPYCSGRILLLKEEELLKSLKVLLEDGRINTRLVNQIPAIDEETFDGTTDGTAFKRTYVAMMNTSDDSEFDKIAKLMGALRDPARAWLVNYIDSMDLHAIGLKEIGKAFRDRFPGVRTLEQRRMALDYKMQLEDQSVSDYLREYQTLYEEAYADGFLLELIEKAILGLNPDICETISRRYTFGNWKTYEEFVDSCVYVERELDVVLAHQGIE